MPRRRYKPGDFDLVVRRARAGLGLFANSPIPKGACVIEYAGPELDAEQVRKSRSLYLFEVNARKTIDGSPRWNTARYINHSCKPNCEAITYKGRVFIFSRRAIKPGEELGYEYGESYVDAYLKGKCRCEGCMPTMPAKVVTEPAKARELQAAE